MRRWGLLLLALGATACGERGDTLRIGAKSFAEQQILASAAQQLLRSQGLEVDAIVQCGDTWACHEALRSGRVDLLFEYTGTGLVYLGEPIPYRDAALGRARELYAPLGLRWLEPLGFDNGYRVVVPSERAAADGLREISDFADEASQLRVACPPSYLRRPLDGLASLQRRYGLRLQGKPLLIANATERFAALRQGRADFAIGYATDGAIVEMGLSVLDDDLGFFPPYDAAPLVREAALKRHPKLAEALGALAGRFDLQLMRRSNYAVEVEGRAPQAAAAELLSEAKLLAVTPAAQGGSALLVALHEDDDFGTLPARVIPALREIYPKRAVQLSAGDNPVRRVHVAEARLALVGAERFFRRYRGRQRRERRIEAVAVVGQRMLHVVKKAGAGPELAGRIGVPAQDSSAARVTHALLKALEAEPARRDRAPELLRAVAKGELDVAVVLAEPGQGALAEALAGGALQLVSLVAGDSVRLREALPYLRAARIPAGVYAGQDAAVETVASQVLLAAPAALPGGSGEAGGPASALAARGQPLERRQVVALADALGMSETPDPVLPSAWRVQRRSAVAGSVGEVGGTLLNAAAIAFVLWLLVLLVKED